MNSLSPIMAASRKRFSVAYRAAVLADSPVAYWIFDESSGSTANDSVGGYHATITGAATWGASGPMIGGKAIRFPSASVYMTQSDSIFQPTSGDWTVEGWFRCENQLESSASFIPIGVYNSTGVNDRSWAIQIQKATSGSYWRAFASTNGTSAIIVGPTIGSGTTEEARNTSTWHHWAFVRDGGTLRLYIDAIQVATQPISGALYNPDLPLRINGMSNSVTGAQDSYAANVAWYTSALSAARILAHYNAAGY